MTLGSVEGPGIARHSALGRLTLATAILGSGIAFLDGTVVNIALPRLGADLGASLAQLQWVVNGYMLALASLILVGGALGDRWGRRRTYLVGVGGFAATSLLCAVAQGPTQLIACRVAQGVAAALLTPGSLALIQGSFRRQDRAGAIGTWAGAAGLTTAIGPFLGGFVLAHGGWRWIFAINVPLCAVVLLLGSRVPESRGTTRAGRFDVPGAVAGVVFLASATYLLTSWRMLATGWTVATLALVVAAVAAFVVLERRPDAMAPLGLFSSRVFSAANAMTLLVYGALGAVSFFTVIQLQVGAGYSPLEAGLASLPITISLLLLSGSSSRLSARIGPRLQMSIGPAVCALGVGLLSLVEGRSPYLTEVFPGMATFALGLAALVAPLTTAVLAAVPDGRAGVASGINNAVARTGSLLAVAALPALVGLAGADYRRAAVLARGYHSALLICAGLLLAGGLVSWFGLGGDAAGREPRPG